MPASPLPDYYEILGVDPAAPADAIKRAYRRQSAVSHPDKGGSVGTFRLVQIAYETLADPDRRTLYDRARTTTPDYEDTPQQPAPERSRPPEDTDPGQASAQQSGTADHETPAPSPSVHHSVQVPVQQPGPGKELGAAPVTPGYRRGLVALLLCVGLDLSVLVIAYVNWPVPPIPVLFLMISAVGAPLCVWLGGRPDLVALRWPPVVAVAALAGGFALAAWRTRTDPAVSVLISLGVAHLVLTLIAGVGWRVWQRTRQLNAIVPRSQLAGTMVFGTPGAGLSAAAAVPVREVADRLFILAQNTSGVSVLHLVGLPAGGRLTAADHVVVAGSKVAVVVTYPVPAARTYSFDSYGNLLADGQHFPNDAAVFRHALADLQGRLPRRFAVRGWIITHGLPAAAGAGPVDTEIQVMGLDSVIPAVNAWLSDQSPVVHRGALAVLAQHTGT